MKKGLNYLTIILFMTILIAPTLLWGIKNVTKSSAFEYTLEENRALAPFPEKISANLPSELEDYYNDHLPFRSALLHGYSVADGKLEGAYINTIQPVLVFLSGRKVVSDSTDLADDYNRELEEARKREEKAAKEAAKEQEARIKKAKEVVEQVDATCTSDGYVKYINKDGEEITETIRATGHEYEYKGIVEPSYTGYGHTAYRCVNCGIERYEDFTEKLIDDSYLPENLSNRQVIIGRYNWLFFVGNDSKAYYTGSNIMDEGTMNAYMGRMQEIKDICDSQGKTVVFVIWPNKEQVYPEYMPSYTIENTVKREQVFRDYVRANSDIPFIYPLEEMTKGKLYRDTYYKYDTHWNYWGSYLGTMALYRELGLEATDYDDWGVITVPSTARGLVATGLLNPSEYIDDIDYEVNYRPEAGTAYAEGNKLLTGGYTEVYKTGTADALYKQHLVLIGDSFRVSMLPYLEKDFSLLTAVQRENMRDVSEDIKNSNIIVVTAVERFDTKMFDSLDVLKEILTE